MLSTSVRPSRPRPLALVALVTAILLLAACASSGGAPTDDGGAEPGDRFPVTIEHIYGSTQIDAEPHRVLTLGLSDHDALLAFGVKPIAVSEWYGGYPSAVWAWATDELEEAEPVVLNEGERDEANPPFEEIAALEPDLIISLYNGTTQEQYDSLSKIAPTVLPTEEFSNFSITWQESVRVVGKVLGRSDDGEELITELEEKFADVATAHPQFEGKEVIVAERFEAGTTVVRSGNDMRALFFEQLGFIIPTELGGIEADEYDELAVSDELMTELSKDLLVWNVGFSPEVRKQLEGNAIYQSLPVVQDDRVLWVEDEVVSGAFSWGTVLSLEYALEELTPELEQVTG
ncbi:MAG: ABC transporter substrate-binding protein [Propionibacteriaceae bacterium]